MAHEQIQAGGAWVGQSVEHQTTGFGSGHDPGVMDLSPTSGSVLSVEPAWDSLSLPLSLSPAHLVSLSLSLSLKKRREKKIR